MTTAHTATPRDAIIAEAKRQAEKDNLVDVPHFSIGYIAAAYEEKCNACDDLVKLIKDAQSILAAHLPPDGISNDEAMHQLLGLLDGPQSRAALAKAGV